jgi:hypothetical protein
VACATKNAKGNKCQTGHRHNGTAITLAVIAKFGEAFEAGAAKPCRLLARNGSAELSNECLILGAKQTSEIRAVTSAYDPRQTSDRFPL